MKWKRINNFLPILYAAFLIFIILIVIKNDVSRLFSIEKTRFFIQSFGLLSTLIFILVVIFFSFVEVIPILLLAILGGLLFGVLLGGIYSLIGIMIGSVGLFYSVRKFGKERFIHKDKLKDFKYIDALMKKDAVYAIYLARIIPIFPNELLVISASLTDINVKDFILIMIIGTLPLIFIAASVGDSFGSTKFSSTLIIIAFLTSLLLSVILFKDRVRKLFYTERVD